MQMSDLFSYGVTQKPPSEREHWGTQELRSSQGHKGQDRTNIQITAGEPRLHSPISPTQGSREVGSELELSLPCPPLRAPSPLPGELYPLAPWRALRALLLPLGRIWVVCLPLPQFTLLEWKEGRQNSLLGAWAPSIPQGGGQPGFPPPCLYYRGN